MNNRFLHLSVKRATVLFLLLSFLTLLLGGTIYILWRPSEHLFFSWIDEIGFGNLIDTIRLHSVSSRFLLPDFVIYSLPNGLWAFAYSMLIVGIWSGSKSKIKYFWLATIPVLVLGFETLQYFEIIRGTFSIQDIAFGITGIIIGIIVGNKITKIKNHEN